MKIPVHVVLTCMVAMPPLGSAFSFPNLQNDLTKRDITINRSSQLNTFRFSSTSAVEELPSIIEDGTNSLQAKIFDPITDIFITTLRVSTCALMIHHGIDKIENVEGFSVNVVAKFFGFLPGDASFWTLSAAATQVGGSFFLALGILSRPVALSMCATMVTAVVFHLLNTGVEGFPLAVVPQHSYNYELAAMYVGVLAYFSVAGAGAYSVDEMILGGELNFYKSLVEEVFRNRDGKEGGLDKMQKNAYTKSKKENRFPWSK